MTTPQIVAYLAGLVTSYWFGLKWGAAVKFIKELGSNA